MFNFIVYGDPCGKGRARMTKMGHAFTPQKTVNYEQAVKQTFVEKYGLGKPTSEILALHMRTYYRIPESKSQKIKNQMEAQSIRPSIKPDIDNVIKIIADSLNSLAYFDDKQIVECLCEKFYSYNPRVEVEIIPLSTSKQPQVSKEQLCLNTIISA